MVIYSFQSIFYLLSLDLHSKPESEDSIHFAGEATETQALAVKGDTVVRNYFLLEN